ncbi:STY0301 family protein [Legionella hackeliae]|uniref:Secreted protein n=1 Tax=Legionella hackeliae TaxID=449 RepID=A0A0A8UNR8_LEGHA|nr:STY0301 family protein [Legionella hackeliae]KTD13809.1 hypothetical protein Lhac_0653 [Legionella hackeliae]CEK10510.1 conserved exported protein of unknown function [Legionella hackeliae]STX47247.1 Uncharacterised protein [Legionella hackeliae]
MNLRCYYFLMMAMILISRTSFSLSGNIPVCPDKIAVKEQLLKLPTGWESLTSDIPHFLNGISVYSGHPRDLVALKPDAINEKKAMWSFSTKDTIYVVCEYNGTSIILTQKIPAKIRHCELIYNPFVRGEKGYIPKLLNCR